jgi:hypothetical protein
LATGVAFAYLFSHLDSPPTEPRGTEQRQFFPPQGPAFALRVTGAEGARGGARGLRVPRANGVRLEEAVGSGGHSFRATLRGKAIRDGQDPRATTAASRRLAGRAFLSVASPDPPYRRRDMARSISRWASRFFTSSRRSKSCLPWTIASSTVTRPSF